MSSTPFFAAIFAIFYVGLSLNVIRHRFGNKISLGDQGHKPLEVAVRIHANFIEYVPFALILFYFLELFASYSTIVSYLASALLLARICHIMGMMNPGSMLVLRQIGTVVTFVVILIASVLLLMHYMPVSV